MAGMLLVSPLLMLYDNLTSRVITVWASKTMRQAHSGKPNGVGMLMLPTPLADSITASGMLEPRGTRCCSTHSSFISIGTVQGPEQGAPLSLANTRFRTCVAELCKETELRGIPGAPWLQKLAVVVTKVILPILQEQQAESLLNFAAIPDAHPRA